MMKSLKNKHIGKFLIIFFVIAFGIVSMYKGIPIMQYGTEFETGTVVGKNDVLTNGKYPKQKFIIAFKFDNPKYGTQDISTYFHTWSSLKVGDRTAFKPNGTIQGADVFWWLMFNFYCCVIFMCIVGTVGFVIYKIWNY